MTTEEKWENALKELPSKKIYGEFSSKVENDELSSDYCKIDESLKVKYGEFEDFCKKIVRNLDKVSKPIKNDRSKKNGTYQLRRQFKENCSFLKYWVYEHLKDMTKNMLTDENINTIMDKIDYIQYDFNKKSEINVCYNNYHEYKDYSEDDKTLYDYFNDFDAIERYVKSVKKTESKFMAYLENIKLLYKKKMDEDLCCGVNFHVCYNYFRCDPKYNPNNLTILLNSKNIEPPVSETADEKKKIVEIGKGTIQPEDKSEQKYRSKINNVKCLVNYGDRENGYAFVSCYSFGKPYPNVEHLFPHTEEEKFEDSKKSTKEAKVSESLETTISTSFPQDVSKAQDERTNNEIREGSSSTSQKIGIPESLKGYSLLGEAVRKGAGEEYVKYQLGNTIAHLFSSIGNTHNKEKGAADVNCSHFKIENGKKTCLQLGNITNYNDASKHGEGMNYSLTNSVTNLFSNETMYNIMDDDFFRIIIVALLFMGFGFVFFIYFKFTPFGTWLRSRVLKRKKIKRDILEEHTRKYVSRHTSRSDNKVPPNRRKRLVYHAS